MTGVVGVVGGSGGVGASTFAAVLAAAAGSALLAALDVTSGGIDVLLGIESVPGARWSGLRLAGGRLDPATLLAGLPRWGGCAVLGADIAALDAGDVGQVLDAATEAQLGCVVLDLPRHDCAARAVALLRCDLVVVLARADVVGLVAAHAVVAGLPEIPLGVVVRRGAVAARRAATLVGVPLLGVVPSARAPLARLEPEHLPRAVAKVATGLLNGLVDRSAARRRAGAAW